MALEVGSFISDLVVSNPVGATDPKAQGDDHIRLIKTVLKNTFPNLNAAVSLTPAQMNQAAFPAGTKMLFVQTAAPVGWTKDVVHNDKALRIVSGAAGTGGTVAFTTAFMSKAVTGSNTGTAITTAQMPSHTHTQQGSFNSGTESADHAHNVVWNGQTDVQGNHSHSVLEGDRQGVSGGAYASGDDYTNDIHSYSNTSVAGAHAHNIAVNANTGGRSAAHFHTTTISGQTAAAGSDGAHTHTFTGTNIDLAVQYVDCIIATKT